MAGSLVQTVNSVTASAGTTVSSSSMNVTAGNLVFWYCGAVDPLDLTQITYSTSGTATLGTVTATGIFGPPSSLTHRANLFAGKVTGSGTFIGTGNFEDNLGSPLICAERWIYAGEITGVDADQTPSVGGNRPASSEDPTTSWNLSVSAANDGAFMLAMGHNQQGIGGGYQSGWTGYEQIDWSGVTGELISQYKTGVAQGNQAIQFDNNDLNIFIMAALAIKEAGGGGGGPSPMPYYRKIFLPSN